ncbi:hypothetical protein LOD99_5659 [Oopsacas minuta]|uniref:Transposase Tc1-like domain-containing protein n=1 Tax=Oopsacas minuta TaxID=111878 RepID=A0AAV7JQH7_9METZ|nr:hypothetical protein LOD99_5659 [Oopsacas minuta]
MVTEYTIDVRDRVIGMIIADMSQTKVSHALQMNLRAIQRWWALSRGGKSLRNKPRRVRKTSLSKAAKIIIAKSLSKPHESTRILTKNLRRRGIVAVSHITILNYLRSLNATPYKPQKQPKLTDSQKRAHVNSAKRGRTGVWKNGDEFYFQMNHHFNFIILRIGKITKCGLENEIIYLR